MKKIILCSLAACNFSICFLAFAQQPAETSVEYLQLPAPLSARDAEISGMTWCGDKLLLLPQFPDFVARRDIDRPKKNEAVANQSFIYYFEKEAIDEQFKPGNKQALVAKAIKLNENNIRQSMANFDGFEAIVCKQNSLWFAMETSDADNRFGTHIAGAKFTTADTITINANPMVEIASVSNRHNASNEALSIFGEQLISIHEVNQAESGKQSVAHSYDLDSSTLGSISFPPLAHRVTDATSVDEAGNFWVINYGFANDPHLANTDDYLMKEFGIGATHLLEANVERLVEMKLDGAGISLTQRAPVPLKLTQENGRNWEGIARYENKGFLIITDKYPQSYFGFVPVEGLN